MRFFETKITLYHQNAFTSEVFFDYIIIINSVYIYIKDIYEGNQQLLVVVSKTLDYFCPKTIGEVVSNLTDAPYFHSWVVISTTN